MNEWAVKKISDVATVIDSLHLTPSYVEEGFPMVRVTDIKGGYLDLRETFKVSNEVYKEFSRKHISQHGDIVFSRVGTYGLISFVKDNTPFCLGQNTVFIVPKISPYYLFYFLNSPFAKHQINSFATGTTQKTISLASINDIEILVPSPQEQNGIANILSCLDRKIENLRKQNETLEEIARSIFKHWFIDFEFPNADGKPYKSSGGVMVRSELGDIPNGWSAGKLGDIITVNPRESVKKGENIKFVDMKSLSTSSMEITDYIYKESPSGSKFRNEDTLLARITPCLENGKTAFVSILDANEVAVGSTEFLILRANNNCCPEYVYALARNPYFRDFAIKNMTGSSGRQRIPTDIILNYKLPVPNIQVMRRYKETCHSLFLKTGSNQKQIQSITKTRDTLLPKLMSGQLRVDE